MSTANSLCVIGCCDIFRMSFMPNGSSVCDTLYHQNTSQTHEKMSSLTGLTITYRLIKWNNPSPAQNASTHYILATRQQLGHDINHKHQCGIQFTCVDATVILSVSAANSCSINLA
jgi:hypothetical protein